jgi:hypothetical protein
LKAVGQFHTGILQAGDDFAHVVNPWERGMAGANEKRKENGVDFVPVSSMIRR